MFHDSRLPIRAPWIENVCAVLRGAITVVRQYRFFGTPATLKCDQPRLAQVCAPGSENTQSGILTVLELLTKQQYILPSYRLGNRKHRIYRPEHLCSGG